jgi:hypothetical protein
MSHSVTIGPIAPFAVSEPIAFTHTVPIGIEVNLLLIGELGRHLGAMGYPFLHYLCLKGSYLINGFIDGVHVGLSADSRV